VANRGDSSDASPMPWLQLNASAEPTDATESASHNVIRITMSSSIVAELCPAHKSDRPEVAQIHLDIIHNPRTAFHFEVNWLGAMANGVDDNVKALTRAIERYGLRVIESPVLTPSGESLRILQLL
jgi:hypothetical protein